MDTALKKAENVVSLFLDYYETHESTVGSIPEFEDHVDTVRKLLTVKTPPEDDVKKWFAHISRLYEIQEALVSLSDLLERDPEIHGTNMSQTFVEQSLKLKAKAMEALASFKANIDVWAEEIIGARTFPNASLEDIHLGFTSNRSAVALFERVITPRLEDPKAISLIQQVKSDLLSDEKEDGEPFVQNCGLMPVTQSEPLEDIMERLYKFKGRVTPKILENLTKNTGLIILHRTMSDLETVYESLLGLKEPVSGPDSSVIESTRTVRKLEAESEVGKSKTEIYGKTAMVFYVITEIAKGLYRQLSFSGVSPVRRHEIDRILKGKNSSYPTRINGMIETEIFKKQKTYLTVPDDFLTITSEEMKTRLRGKKADEFLPTLVKMYEEREKDPTSEERFTFVHATYKQYLSYKAELKKNRDEENALTSVPSFEDILYKRRLVVS